MANVMVWLAALSLLSGTALAQTAPARLRLITEDVDTKPAARTCGITTSGITSSIRAAMRYNRVPEANEVLAPIIYTVVTPITLNNGCALSARVEIRRHQVGQLDGIEKPLIGSLQFCSAGGVMSGPAYDMGQRLSSALKELFESCLGEISEKATRS